MYKTHFFLPKFDQKWGYILYIGTKFFPFFFQSTFLNTAGVLLMISHVMRVVWVYIVYLTSRISSLIWILFPSIRILPVILSDIYSPFHNQPPSDYVHRSSVRSMHLSHIRLQSLFGCRKIINNYDLITFPSNVNLTTVKKLFVVLV